MGKFIVLMWLNCHKLCSPYITGIVEHGYPLCVNGGCGECYGSVDIVGIAVVIARGPILNLVSGSGGKVHSNKTGKVHSNKTAVSS